jgi:hypothetical protein
MRHVREVDANDHTVIMVQVENEIGMIPDSRDRSTVANQLFSERVPAELMNYLSEHKEQLIPEFRTVVGGEWLQDKWHVGRSFRQRASD